MNLKAIRPLLFRWSLGQKIRKASEISVPKELYSHSFMLVCENKSEIERLMPVLKEEEAYIDRFYGQARRVPTKLSDNIKTNRIVV